MEESEEGEGGKGKVRQVGQDQILYAFWWIVELPPIVTGIPKECSYFLMYCNFFSPSLLLDIRGGGFPSNLLC